MNGIYSSAINGNGNGNGNGSSVFFNKKPLSFLNRIFNIGPAQWSRVAECWLITFFFKLGVAIGWTVLTAAFVGRFGISLLPALFVINAVLIILSTFFFEQLITRIKREVLMIIMVILGAILIFFAAVVYERNPMAFFALVIFAESVFLAQFNVFIPILVGDRFTPLESQRTFSFVESADTVGGLIGGTVVGILAAKFPISWFFYLWIGFLICIIFVFVIMSHFRIGLPPLPFRIKPSSVREKPQDQIKLVFSGIKKFAFLKGLVLVVLLQWVFMNILEFQYTKAVEQSVTHKYEATIAHIDPVLLKAATLNSEEAGKSFNKEESAQDKRALTAGEQILLTEKLGKLKGIFYAVAFIVQILVASRIITALGIVGSMLLYPVAMLMSLVGMFLKFGFSAAVITRAVSETANVVHKNAYFASHYAFPKLIRDQSAEFLEGMVRPMGTIIGMLFIAGLQLFWSGSDLTMFIHLMMFGIMVVIFLSTVRLQSKYTRISRDQLFARLPYPEHLNAIEILAQRGHSEASVILVEKLNKISLEKSEEAAITRIKLLEALGQFRDYQFLPDILGALYDENSDVRLEAAHTLMNFRDIGEKFYSQAFSRYRMIEILKDVFKKEKSATVRSAIIRLFSLIKQQDIVDFLLDLLKNEDPKVKADCIYTLGLFRDPNAGYYIFPYISNENPEVRANAVIALRQFPKYKTTVEEELNSMLKSRETFAVKSGIFALGELRLPRKRFLEHCLGSENPEIRLEAAFALTKCAEPSGFHIILEHFFSLPEHEFESLRRFLHRLNPKARQMVENLLIHFVSEKLNALIKQYPSEEISLSEVDPKILEELKRSYKLLDQHEELYVLEQALKDVHN